MYTGFASGVAQGFDTVIYAVGRDACTKSIGLEKLGVALDRSGAMIVDDADRALDADSAVVPGVYALGDCSSACAAAQLTPVAIQAGERLVRRIFGGAEQLMDYAMVPTTLFTPAECVGSPLPLALPRSLCAPSASVTSSLSPSFSLSFSFPLLHSLSRPSCLPLSALSAKSASLCTGRQQKGPSLLTASAVCWRRFGRQVRQGRAERGGRHQAVRRRSLAARQRGVGFAANHGPRGCRFEA